MPIQNVDQLIIPIPGSCTLKEIKNVIRFHEGYLWRLKDNTVEGKMNKVLLVPSPSVPTDFDFGAGDAKVSDGRTKEATFKLRYNGAEQSVVVFRVTAA